MYCQAERRLVEATNHTYARIADLFGCPKPSEECSFGVGSTIILI
jgi:hypothetical protein